MNRATQEAKPRWHDRRYRKLTWIETYTGLTLAEVWLALLGGMLMWIGVAVGFFALATLAAMAGAI